MQDSVDKSLIESGKQRYQGERKALLSQMEQLAAEEQAAAQPKVSPGTPSGPAAAPSEGSDRVSSTSLTEIVTGKPKPPGLVSETFKAITGGVQDAVYNTGELARDLAVWVEDNRLRLRSAEGRITHAPADSYLASSPKEANAEHAKDKLNPSNILSLRSAVKIPENKSTVGKIGRSVTQFLVPFLAATKALKVAGVRNIAVRGLAGGAATDFAAFDGQEANLSKTILDLTDNDPLFGKALLTYLASNPEGGNFEGRYKRSLEGLGLGLAAEGVFKLGRGIYTHYWSQGKNPVEEISKAIPDAPVEAIQPDVVASGSKPAISDTTLQNQINSSLGISDPVPGAKWQKRLDVAAAARQADTEVATKEVNALADEIDLTKEYEGIQKSSSDARATAAEASAIGDVKAGVTPLADVPPASFGDSLKSAEDAVSGGQAYKVAIDSSDGSLVLAKGELTPTQTSLDTTISDALKKGADQLSEADHVALSGYKALQETALGKTPQKIAELASKGTTPEEVIAAVKANDAELLKKAGRSTKQGGSISPSALGNLVAAQIGGITGYNSADDDASFAEKLSLAGVGALTAMGIKAGVHRVLRPSERAAVENADPLIKSMSRPEAEGIRPLSPSASYKTAPRIDAVKARALTQAVINGDNVGAAQAFKESGINLRRIDTAEDVKDLLQATEDLFDKEIGKATGNVRTFAMIEENANLSGSSVEHLKKLYRDTANLDSKIFAGRVLLVNTAEDALALAKVAARTGAPEDILAAEKAIKLSAAIQAQVRGAGSEAARAVSAMRMTASNVVDLKNEMNDVISSMGGYDARHRLLTELAEFDDLSKASAAMRYDASSLTSRVRNAILEVVTLGRLWSPISHVANFVGNTLTVVGTLAERENASLIGKYIRRDAGAIQQGEVKAMAFGMLSGLEDALRITAAGRGALKESFGKAIKGDIKGAGEVLSENVDEFGASYRTAVTGIPVGRSSSLATADYKKVDGSNAIAADKFGLPTTTLDEVVNQTGELSLKEWLGVAVDTLGTLTSIPGRALGFSDELFWAIHYRGEMHAQAYRQAASEGLEGQAFISRIADMLYDPSPEMRAFALEAAQSGTFTAPLKGAIKRGGQFIDEANLGAIPVGRLIVPFVRTPANIMKYAAERTPLVQRLTDVYKSDMAAGGVRADLARSRAVTGAALLTLGTTLAAGFDINGTSVKIIGGGDLNQTAERVGGIQPYSLVIGDGSYAFNRLDPHFGIFLGLSADFSEILGHLDTKSAGDITSAATLAISRNLTSKTYLSGLAELTNSLSEAKRGNTRALTHWYQNQVAGTMPFSSAFNVARKVDDPVVREVFSLMDAFRNKLPGGSDGLPPVRNMFGEIQKFKGGLGPDIASPIMTSSAATDPAATEIARLDLDLKRPPRTLTFAVGSPGIDLTPQQYDRFAQLVGNEFKDPSTKMGFKDALLKHIASPKYLKLPEQNADLQGDYPDGKQLSIQTLYTAYKRGAMFQMLEEFPPLKKAFLQDKNNAANAILGIPVKPLQ